MSYSTVTFYPVDNGAMTLLKLNDAAQTTLLIDINIRALTTEEGQSTDYYDVGTALRQGLKRDEQNRPYVDAFLVTHNDQDHVRGFEEHFHVGPVADYREPDEGETGKILIHELWTSYRFWERDSESSALCADAKAVNKEMKRRVRLYQDSQTVQGVGDRAIIFCKDPDGGTDNVLGIVRELDSVCGQINGRELAAKCEIKVLAPLPRHEGEDEEQFNERNRGCVILSIRVKEGTYEDRLLMPADAEVDIWDAVWTKWKALKSELSYDVLMTPHHTSWHSLSHDSRSQCEDPKVSADARSALSQSKAGAFIVSSSKPVKDDDEDPPCFASKEEYVKMVEKDRFLCTEEYPREDSVDPIVINLTGTGAQEGPRKAKARSSTAAVAATGVAFPHGST